MFHFQQMRMATCASTSKIYQALLPAIADFLKSSFAEFESLSQDEKVGEIIALHLLWRVALFHYPSGFFETLLKAAFIYKFIQTTLNQFNNFNSVDSIPIIHAEDAWNGQCVSFVQISASRHVS